MKRYEHASSKAVEQLRRATANPSGDHNCTTFSDETVTPKKWRETVLNCRVCRRNLVVFYLSISSNLLEQGRGLLLLVGLRGMTEDRHTA